MQQQIETREFKRSSVYVNLLFGIALLFGFVGSRFLIKAELITAVMWFIASGLLLLNYFLSKRFPYIRITKDTIIFPAIARRQKAVRWDTIQKFSHVSNKKIELMLSNDETVKIYLSLIDKKDRENLIQILESGIEEKNN